MERGERERDLQGDETEGGGNGHDLGSVQDPTMNDWVSKFMRGRMIIQCLIDCNDEKSPRVRSP